MTVVFEEASVGGAAMVVAVAVGGRIGKEDDGWSRVCR
jgi:hypothetical protein